MSHPVNQEIMERLYEEAYEDLWGSYWINTNEQHHEAAIALAKKRFEEDYS